jgi:hypothetical protein
MATLTAITATTRIERIAREHHLSFLELDSSLTAEPFYAWLGYKSLQRTDHLSVRTVHGLREDAEGFGRIGRLLSVSHLHTQGPLSTKPGGRAARRTYSCMRPLNGHPTPAQS